MSMIADLVARGEVSEKATSISFLREQLGDDGTTTFEKHTSSLGRAATVLPATKELMSDVPAMKTYVDQRGAELFKRTLGDIVVTAIEEAGARHIRPKIFETNRHAIKRALHEVKQDGEFTFEVAPVDRTMTVVGPFAEGITLWTQGEVTAEATNVYDDYFTRDLVAIRLEQPAVVTVYRPRAFAIVKTRGWERLRRLWWRIRR